MQDGILRTGKPLVGFRLLGGQLPAMPERSRAMSLLTSFGSCGPIYEPAGRGCLGASRSRPGLSALSAAAMPRSVSR